MTDSNVIPLRKGVPIPLSKEDGSALDLKKVHIGAGWDVSRDPKEKFDLDLVFLLLGDSKAKTLVTQSNGKPGIVYHHWKESACGSVILDKDCRLGGTSVGGYDENGNLNLEQLPPEIGCIVALINIFDEDNLGQTFGRVENAFIDVNVEGMPSIKVDLTEDYSSATAVNVAEIYRHDGGWRVKKIGIGFDGGLEQILHSYGAQTSK